MRETVDLHEGAVAGFHAYRLGVLLNEIVRASDSVAATSARNEKIAILADVLARTAPEDVPVVVAWLTGETRQGRIGVGWVMVSQAGAEPAHTPTLTVVDLDSAIELMAGTTGAGSQAERRSLLQSLLSRATAEEVSFIGRLLVGEIRQGALAGMMIEAVAKAAQVPATSVRRALMLSGDLGGTARTALEDGRAGLQSVRLRLLRPVQPMLAATAEDVEDALPPDGLSRVEYKLDGIRIQVHRNGPDVRVFTRNLNDVTARVPEIVDVASGLESDRFVLDGELLGFVEDDRPEMFQDTMSRFGREDASALPTRVRPFFFDVLHADGDDLLDEPLSSRLDVLEGVAGEHRVPGTTTAHAEEVGRFMEQAVAAGHEGVMVKGVDTPYAAGRRGKAWRKVKPVHVFDLVVIAAEWGHGRRRGWLSNLHLGARDPDTNSFVMVGKTFKGLTDELLTWQTEALLGREIGREGNVVHVRPELVVEIALDGVQVSSRYPGGIALRFARVRRYREDKPAAAADTLDALRALLP